MNDYLRILHVEDRESDASLVQRILEKAGLCVYSERVEDAVEMRAALTKQSWDAIICDYALPDFDAPAALQVAHETGLDIPFIVVSGTIGEDIAVDMMRGGAHDYLMKDRLARLPAAVSREIEEARLRQERRQVLAALHHHEALLRAVCDNTADYMVLKDLAGRIVLANPAALGVLGKPPAEVIGQTDASLFADSALAAAIMKNDRQVMQQGIVQSVEEVVQTPAGRRTFLSTKTPWRDAQGRVVGIVAVAHDITELKSAETALRESEEQFRTLFQDAPIGIALTGLDTRFIRVNTALKDMLGYREDDLLALSVREITCAADRRTNATLLARLLSGEIPQYQVESRFVRAGGEVLSVSIHNSLIRGSDRTPLYLLGTIENITDRKQQRERIQQLNIELDQRIKALTVANADLESFTYSVAHDLRAPLRHVDGFSKMLSDALTGQLDPTAQKYLHTIRHSSRRMGIMVDELLNFSRVGRVEPRLRPVDLGKLVEETVADLAPEIAQRRIEWRIGALPNWQCDPVLMKQVFANLIGNAVKFTRRRERALIDIGRTVVKSQETVFVRDNGVGFDMKYADQLFGVFKRLHRAEDFEGTGIGLANAQRIIQKHGGRIWADAELNKGAAFYFFVPQDPSTQPGASLQTAGVRHDAT
jgi:PAS domain S-box-containing protein